MESEYYIEKEIESGFDFLLFFQKSKPNKITTAAHMQDSIEFIYVKEGIYTAFINQARHTLHPGDLLLILSRDIHSLRAEQCEKNGYYVLKVDPNILYDSTDKSPYKYVAPFKFSKENKKCLWTCDELESSELLGYLSDIIDAEKSKEYAYKLCIKAKCMQLLLYILREWEQNATDKDANAYDISVPIYRTIEYIHQNYNHDISVTGCAASAGMSYSYFSRKFTSTVGKSFREYLNQVRCNNAERLLMTTDKSISEISSECGYNDICYFISVFKALRGDSPSKYRRKLMSDDKS